ncbi:MAG: hypothetical protein AAFX96_06235 [Pseudomonadota bacterium]
MSLLFKVELWSPDQNRVEELLGELSGFTLAKAAYDAAVGLYPGKPVTIRQGARVIEKTDSVR